MKRINLFVLTLFLIWGTHAETERRAKTAEPNPELLEKKWDARWIAYPGVSLYDYGVYHFRKIFRIKDLPVTYVINVSADNRYRLFVNGTPVCYGPARGDLSHWYFETVDIAPLLKEGDNVLAALVWNMSSWRSNDAYDGLHPARELGKGKRGEYRLQLEGLSGFGICSFSRKKTGCRLRGHRKRRSIPVGMGNAKF